MVEKPKKPYSGNAAVNLRNINTHITMNISTRLSNFALLSIAIALLMASCRKKDNLGSEEGKGSTDEIQVEANNHSTLLLKDGILYGTGSVGLDRFNDDPATRFQFGKIAEDVIGFSGGEECIFYIKKDSTLWAGGLNSSGRLGSGTSPSVRSDFVKVSESVRSVHAGYRHTLIIKNDNSLWGAGHKDGLGLGSDSENSSSFVRITGGVKDAKGGHWGSIILKLDGSVWTTGGNNGGMLGSGTGIPDFTFKQVASGAEAIESTTSTNFYLAGKRLYAAGPDYGVWAGNNTSSYGEFVPIMSGIVDFAAGLTGQVVLEKEDGTIWATGTSERPNTLVQLFDAAKAISGGWEHLIVLDSNDELWGTGSNYAGALGMGEIQKIDTWTKIPMRF